LEVIHLISNRFLFWSFARYARETVLIAHDSKKATGWFIGTVRFFGVSEKDKEKCSNATH
jgi:hypothetical protein